ncbi:MAG: hypothetical protein Kilf2KO_26280 [Rhodospirillales bacterium]
MSGMKLYYSRNSPFARIARLALREGGLLASVSEVAAANRRSDNPVLDHSPVGRVPTLVDGDLVVTEARYVYDYIAERSGFAALQTAARATWRERAQEGQILGFVEGIASWVREMRRAPADRSAFLIAVEQDRSTRCLTHLETEATAGRLPDFPAFASLALASGLGLMDLHRFRPDWRRDHPALGAWFDPKAARSSMRETAPL